jgi:hypothetical protein
MSTVGTAIEVPYKDPETLRQTLLRITPDQLVEVQNVSGGKFHVHDLRSRPEDPALDMAVDQIMDLRDLELSPATIRRSCDPETGGLGWAYKHGKLLVLSIKLADGRVVRIATPRGTPVKFNKETGQMFVDETWNDKKGYYDERLKLLRTKQRRDSIETKVDDERTEDEEKIASGQAEEEIARNLKTLEASVTGNRGPANNAVNDKGVPIDPIGVDLVRRAEEATPQGEQARALGVQEPGNPETPPGSSEDPDPLDGPAAGEGTPSTRRDGLSVSAGGRGEGHENKMGVDAGRDRGQGLDDRDSVGAAAVPKGKNQGEKGNRKQP